MSILNLDMFVLSFDMFLLVYYQSDLNLDQFDLNLGQIIYSYSNQFASTATTASSPSPRNFLCRFRLRGDSWGVAIRTPCCLYLYSPRGNGAGLRLPWAILGIRKPPLRHSCPLLSFLRE